MSTPSGQPNRFERHPWRTGLGLLALIVLLSEGTLRLAAPTTVTFARQFRTAYAYHPRWYVDFVPDTTTRIRLAPDDGAPQFDFRLAINADGFRGAITPGAAHRIHAIGDSYTMGWGVEEQEAWPARLDQRLGPSVGVLNLGLNGYGTVAATEKSLALSDRYPPSAVIYLFTGNDPRDDDHAAAWAERSPVVHALADALNVLRHHTMLANVPFALRWDLAHEPPPERIVPPGATDRLDIRPITGPPDSSLSRRSKDALAAYAQTLQTRGIPLLVVAHGEAAVCADMARYAQSLGVPAVHVIVPDSLLLLRDNHFAPDGHTAIARLLAAHPVVAGLASTDPRNRSGEAPAGDAASAQSLGRRGSSTPSRHSWTPRP